MPNLVKFIHLTDDDKAALENILRQSTVEESLGYDIELIYVKREEE